MQLVFTIRRLLPIFGLVALALIVSGCGATAGPVAGTVTLNGKAPNLDGLTISFVGADGQPVSAAVSKDGKYRAERVPAGEVRVSVVYLAADANEAFHREAQSRGEEGPPKKGGPPRNLDGPRMDPSKNPIPSYYADFATSRLSTKVESGKVNEYNVDLKR